MELYGVLVNADDTVRVVSVPVVKETAKSYFIARPAWDVGNAFGMRWVERIDKRGRAFTSACEALDAYMAMRQSDKAAALSVAGQATKQIASANELRQAMAKADRQAAGEAGSSPRQQGGAAAASGQE